MSQFGDQEWRRLASERLDRRLNLPMLVLSVLLIPLIIFPLIKTNLSSATRGTLTALDYLIWAVFLVEYLVRLAIAPERLRFFRTNLLDLVLVAIPMLRPLRIARAARLLRAARLVRLAAAAGEGARRSRHRLIARAPLFAGLCAGLLVTSTAAVVLDLERDQPGSNIHNFGDAIWWGVSTITTVGYGDRFPVTAGGRAIAVVLMISGIVLLGVITASLAAVFTAVTQEEAAEAGESDDAVLTLKLDRLQVMLDQLRHDQERQTDQLIALLGKTDGSGAADVPSLVDAVSRIRQATRQRP